MKKTHSAKSVIGRVFCVLTQAKLKINFFFKLVVRTEMSRFAGSLTINTLTKGVTF